MARNNVIVFSNDMTPMAEIDRELGAVVLSPVGPGLRRGALGVIQLAPALGSGITAPATAPGSPAAGVLPGHEFNADYQASPIALAAWNLLTVFSFDNDRKTFQIQNTGANTLYVLFQNVSATVRDYSAAADQPQLTVLSSKAIAVLSGNFYEPYKPPRGAVSIFALGLPITGLAISGA